MLKSIILSVGSLLIAANVGSQASYAQDHNFDFVQDVIVLTNQQRTNAGLPALRVSGILAMSAQNHSDDMSHRNYLSHNSPEGVTPRTRMLAVGYDPNTYTSENFYYGTGNQSYTSPQAAVNWWMNSPGHRANILDPQLTEIGVGLAITVAEGKYIYVQNFGSAPTTGAGNWGALAYSASIASYGSAKDEISEVAAQTAAMQKCMQNATDCVIAASYRKGCGVIKRDEATGIWGAGVAGGSGMPALNAAGMFARSRCVQSGGQICNSLVVATCSL